MAVKKVVNNAAKAAANKPKWAQKTTTPGKTAPGKPAKTATPARKTPPAKAAASKKPKPEDDNHTFLQKVMPKRSAVALKPVAVWLESACNVSSFADLEGAEAWAPEVKSLLESDDSLSLGAKGLIKELMKMLPTLVGADDEPEAEEDEAEEEPEAEEEEAEAEEEDAAEEEAPEEEDEVEEDDDDENEHDDVSEEEAKPVKKGAAKAKAKATSSKKFQRVFLEPPDEVDEGQLQVIEEARAEMEVQVLSKAAKKFAPIMTFEELSGVIPPFTMQALIEMEFEAPLPVQAQALPMILGGHDVTGIAKTGSGKTLAYLLPAVVHIEAQDEIKVGKIPTPICLILAPTRELVVQICEEATKLLMKSNGESSHSTGIWSCVIYGGKSKEEQMWKARKGTHIMAATPGRLCDHLRNKEISLHRCTYFVLDEADRMLEEGFSCELKAISDLIRPDRQMCFFSATWPKEVSKLAADLCISKKKPFHLAVGQRADKTPTTRQEITQQVIVFNQDSWEEREQAKKEVLYAHLREVLAAEEHKCLVFVGSKVLADELRDTLWEEGFKTDSMHGGRSQDQRLAVLKEFKHGEMKCLVCTDVMGRGLDIPDISHVVIYDMGDCDDYVHRIGRTARGPTGQGHALTLFELDRKWPMIAQGLVEILESSDQEVPDELREIAKEVEEMGGGPPTRKKYGGEGKLAKVWDDVGPPMAKRAKWASGGKGGAVDDGIAGMGGGMGGSSMMDMMWAKMMAGAGGGGGGGGGAGKGCKKKGCKWCEKGECWS